MNKKIPASVRNKVWVTHLGRVYEANCVCCGVEPITKSNFECGHIVSRKDGGEISIQNLRPICSLCNKSMGTMNMMEFMKKYGYDINIIGDYECNNDIIDIRHTTIEDIENMNVDEYTKLFSEYREKYMMCCEKIKTLYDTKIKIIKYLELMQNKFIDKHNTGNENGDSDSDINSDVNGNNVQLGNIENYVFTSSKILECNLNNNIIIRLKYKHIIESIYDILNDRSLIMKNTVLNIQKGQKTNHGYTYNKNLDISIQRVDANKCIKEIVKQCTINNINISMKIKLKNGDVVHFNHTSNKNDNIIRSNKKWSLTDELWALYNYKYPDDYTIDEICSFTGIKKSSFKMKLSNIKYLDAGIGLSNYSKLNRAVYDIYHNYSKTQLEKHISEM